MCLWPGPPCCCGLPALEGVVVRGRVLGGSLPSAVFSQLGGWALPPRYLPSLQAWRLQGWTEAPGVPSYLIPTLSPL